jgi:hypothetical protein
VAILNWLEQRVERLAHQMGNLVTQIFTEDLLSKPASTHPLAINPTLSEKDSSEPLTSRHA